MGHKKIFSVKEIEQLITNKNYSINDLFKYFKTSKPTMGKFLKENNIKTEYSKNKDRIEQINEKDLVKEYLSGLSSYKLEKKYKISASSIIKILKRNKVQLRTNSEAHILYSLNKNYFDNIDTMNKAYLLGFICADGWVTDRNEIGIALQKRDKAMIEFFKAQIKTDKPIKELEHTYELRVQNKIMKQSLEKLGIVPRKSLILDIGKIIKNSNLNEKQISVFLLGYFDGDGNIYEYIPRTGSIQYSCSVTGTLETCLYFKEYFGNVGFLTQRFPERKNNNWTYQIGGRNLVYNSLAKIYNYSNELDYFYNRKKEIFCRSFKKKS